jgi:hypothetical protein
VGSGAIVCSDPGRVTDRPLTGYRSSAAKRSNELTLSIRQKSHFELYEDEIEQVLALTINWEASHAITGERRARVASHPWAAARVCARSAHGGPRRPAASRRLVLDGWEMAAEVSHAIGWPSRLTVRFRPNPRWGRDCGRG